MTRAGIPRSEPQDEPQRIIEASHRGGAEAAELGAEQRRRIGGELVALDEAVFGRPASRAATGTRYLGFSGADRGALVMGATMTVLEFARRSVRTTTAGCGPFMTWPPRSGKSM